MAVTIQRMAQAVWNGDLKSGQGQFSLKNGVLRETSYNFGTRFKQTPDTNPEELIAAAHAACYSMAFAHTLSNKGHPPQSVETQAVCSLEPQASGGFKITKIRLETRGQVPGYRSSNFPTNRTTG